jgi:adenine-specific DNA-methyltransferase
LFADPQEDLREALKFYEHDVDWSNRMILGDSLAVMASLARREGLAGKVQMIYCDFPYGIKYASNFQPEVDKRMVTDKQEDLSREPEVVKAYRDTWTLGVHSYLKYVRDRLLLMRELLTDSGSVFVQISDENLHFLRNVLDEVFGPSNFRSQISFMKTSGLGSAGLYCATDFLLWYSKDSSRTKYHQLYRTKVSGEIKGYDLVERPSGCRERGEPMSYGDRVFKAADSTSQGNKPTEFNGFGRRFVGGWKTNLYPGMERLYKSSRLHVLGNTLAYVRYIDDFSAFPITSHWSDTGIAGYASDKLYVVQTLAKVIERCMLMTTDPGDLVCDPTLGSGTTAYVAEEWGRRWIGVDTSRVALAIARQRLLTAKYDYYKLRPTSAEDVSLNPFGPWLRDTTGEIQGTCTLECKTVSHIKLGSIAQNQALDSIFDKWQAQLVSKLAVLNQTLATEISDGLRNSLFEKAKASLTPAQRKRIGSDFKKLKSALSDTEWRQWVLPPDNRPGALYTTVSNDLIGWYDWEVPFDSDYDWPVALRKALEDYRAAWRQKMDEVNRTIQARAEQEELVDQPNVLRNVTRVSGPFTVEGVIPIEESISLDEPSPVDEYDGDLITFESEYPTASLDNMVADPHIEPLNAEAYVDKMLRLLGADGVRFPNNKVVKIDNLKLTDVVGLHAEGEWNIDGEEHRVGVVFGPQYGPLNDAIIQDAMPAANSIGCKDVVFAAFSFDGTAQATIQQNPNPRLKLHMAQIRPDVNMGDLLKTTTSSQIFTVSGTPRIVARLLEDDEYEIEMQGVDIYDPITNSIRSAGGEKVAAWFLDSDYDGRTFCITQAFFPDKKAWEKLAKALSSSVDSDVFESFSGTISRPFKPGRQVAVKVIDPRGNEVMWVKRLGTGNTK